MLVPQEQALLWVGILVLVHAVIQLMGPLFKWRFIFCYQRIMYNTRMTPYYINWSVLDKMDIYGVPILEAVCGCLAIVLYTIEIV